jgi:hypothetical protein
MDERAVKFEITWENDQSKVIYPNGSEGSVGPGGWHPGFMAIQT